jgi:hypothetical protein
LLLQAKFFAALQAVFISPCVQKKSPT